MKKTFSLTTISVLIVCLFVLSGCGEKKNLPIQAMDIPSPASTPRETSEMDPPPAPADFDCIPHPGGSKTIKWTPVPYPGDYNLDGEVSGRDLFSITAHFGVTAEDEGFSADVDGNGDQTIDELDVPVIAEGYGNAIAGWRLYRSEYSDGREARVAIDLIPWDAESPGQPMEADYQQPDFAPGFYFLRAMTRGLESESGSTPVRPRERLILRSVAGYGYQLISLDGTEKHLFSGESVGYPSETLHLIAMSTDRSTVIGQLHDGTSYHLYLLVYQEGSWEISEIDLSEIGAPGTYHFKEVKVSGNGSQAIMVIANSDFSRANVYSIDLLLGSVAFGVELPLVSESAKYQFLSTEDFFSHYYFDVSNVTDEHVLVTLNEHFAETARRTLGGKFSGYLYMEPRISGDGSRILGIYYQLGEQSAALHSLLLEDMTFIKHNNSQLSSCQFNLSHFGDRAIYFGGWQSEDDEFLRTFTTEGSEVHEIAEGGMMHARTPDISPDGLFIVYNDFFFSSGKHDIIVADFDGSNKRVLIDKGDFAFPNFR